MIKDKIIKDYEFYLFGCSHTANMQADFQFILDEIHCKPHCIGGNSNDKIIRDLKNEIIRLTDGFTKKVNNIYFNIQFTYFNRNNIFSDLENRYIPFHSPNVFNQPFGTKDKNNNEIYNQFYADWLTYFFNEENRLKELIIECKILKSLMDSFGIKYNWYLWAGINNVETTNSQKEIEEKKMVLEDTFQKLGFYKFDDFWYFDDYAKKNKLRLKDDLNKDNNTDEHLTFESNKILLELIFDIFYNKINEK